jgi:hypothetical protein
LIRGGRHASDFIFKTAGVFSEGMADVLPSKKLLFFDVSKAYGYIDRKGHLAIEPTFDLAFHFSEGLATVKKNFKWGFIDSFGELVIDYQFDDVEEFSGGACAVAKDGKWFLIDKNGHTIDSRVYPDLGIYDEGIFQINGVEKIGSEWLETIGYVESSSRVIWEPTG